jgi:hypothetical protein
VNNVVDNILDLVGDVLQRGVDGLTVEQLKLQPASSDANPIGWLAWHLTRAQDRMFSMLMNKEQAWFGEGWHSKFGVADPQAPFSGVSADEVRAFDPVSSELLVAYYQAVRVYRTKYLESITAEELAKPAPSVPNRPDSTVGETLARVCSDNVQHAGQIAYVRGILSGHGWYGR